jgi:hypothetical protein
VLVYSALNKNISTHKFAKISRYADISKEMYEGECLLLIMARENNFAKILVSCEYIGNFDVKNNYQMSCFYYACYHYNIQAMEVLADRCNKNIPRDHLHPEVVAWLDEKIEVDCILHELIK